MGIKKEAKVRVTASENERTTASENERTTASEKERTTASEIGAFKICSVEHVGSFERALV